MTVDGYFFVNVLPLIVLLAAIVSLVSASILLSDNSPSASVCAKLAVQFVALTRISAPAIGNPEASLTQVIRFAAGARV